MEPQEKLSSYVILRPPTITKIVWNLLGNDTAGGALLDLLRQTKHSHSSALARLLSLRLGHALTVSRIMSLLSLLTGSSSLTVASLAFMCC